VIKSFIKSVTQYDEWRDSRVGESVLRLCHPATGHIRAKERSFYRSLALVSRPWDVVFDIGANTGAKAVIFERLANRVVCVEPDQNAVAALRARFAGRRSISIIQGGLSDKVGEELFSVEAAGSPYNSFSEKWVGNRTNAHPQGAVSDAVKVKVSMMTLESLMREYGVPDYIKIDVEGYEEKVLAGLNRPVPLLSFEANLPAFEHETCGCIRRLRELSRQGQYNFSASEPPLQFVLPEWVDGDEIAAEVMRRKFSFMEIFWRNLNAVP
jgi:FkbM family methyltransferase